MSQPFIEHLQHELDTIESQGLYKRERPLDSPQDAQVHVQDRDSVLINLCANNYLGLANHPDMVAAAQSIVVYHFTR